MCISRLALGLIIVLFPLALFASENDGEAKTETENSDLSETGSIAEVVVSASRSEEEAFFSNRSVDIIGSKEIAQNQPRSTPELFRESTGVFVQHTNYGGGSPIIRGNVGPQVLLLLDGIRLNNSVFRTGPLQYANFIDPYQLQRVEVVRGPGSVLYGSDAIGGVINAISHSPKDRRNADQYINGRVMAKYGSAAGEATVHGLIDGGYSWFGANAGVSYKDFNDLEGGGDVGSQPYTSYRQVNATGKLSARLSDGFVKDWRFDIGYSLTRMYDVGRAEKLEVNDSINRYQNEHDLVYLKGHMIVKPILTDFDLTFAYQRFFEEKDSVQLDSGHNSELSVTRDHTGVDTLSLDGQFTTRLFKERLRLVYGAEYYHDRIDSSRRERKFTRIWKDGARTPFPDGSAYYLAGGYLHATGETLPEEWDWKLTLTAGYRIQGMGGEADATDDAPAVDYDNLAHVFMAGVQASYLRYWTAAFTYTQGFRSPNLQESVQVGDVGDWYHVANDGLSPERSDTLELLTRFDAWKLHGSLAGYISFIEDIIKREPSTFEGAEEYMGKLVVENANGGEGRLYGVEASLGADIPWGFSLSADITYTYGVEMKDEEPDEAISKIPPLFGSAKLRWQGEPWDGFRLFAETYLLWAAKQDRLSEGDKKDIRIPEGGTPSWITWNVRTGLDIYDHGSINLTLENITDEKYKYHASGVYGAGFNAIIGLEARL